MLVLNAGYREAARSLFGEAVRRHPDNANGRVNLANLLFFLESKPRRTSTSKRRSDRPGPYSRNRGMANLLAARGDMTGARAHCDKGFKGHALTVLLHRGEGTPINVLLLVSAAGGNIPTISLLDDRQFQTSALVTDYADPILALPPHDLVLNSIGDADLCGEGLEAACAIVARTTRPVINHPTHVLRTGRAANVARLRGLPNVVVPQMTKLPKRTLMGPDAAAKISSDGFVFPLLVRAPGFHTGHHFAHVETPEQLAARREGFSGR